MLKSIVRSTPSNPTVFMSTLKLNHMRLPCAESHHEEDTWEDKTWLQCLLAGSTSVLGAQCQPERVPCLLNMQRNVQLR